MQNSPKDLRKKLLGRKGEDLTVKYLKENGYKIVERNFQTSFGEADIIALKDGVYCFVEVKTRTSTEFGEPSEAVNHKKRERYRKIAWSYCNMLREEVPCRFDIASILGEKLEYFENAYI